MPLCTNNKTYDLTKTEYLFLIRGWMLMIIRFKSVNFPMQGGKDLLLHGINM